MTPGPRTPKRSPFAHPAGFRGRLAAEVMAFLGRRRSGEVLRRLGICPGDRVLEIGFGAGRDLARSLAGVGERGLVTGIDSSETVVQMVRRRLRHAVTLGRLSVVHASADAPLPFDDGTFDRAFSINSYQFWQAPLSTLQELRRIVVPGGKVVLAVQPRGRLAQTTEPPQMLHRLAEALEQSGFAVTDQSLFPLRPRAVAIAEALRSKDVP